MTEFALIPENETFFTSAGDLASGYQLFIYEAGSSTKATTHRDSDGLVANTNPIVLDSLGQTPYGVYVPTGTYKTVFTTDTDTDPPATAIRTRDNITPRNDATAAAQSEWVVGPTPTYTSGTTFTLVGDQTSTFHVGRRLKLVDSGGTSYAVISVTEYTSLTTVTVVNDATAIDSGLSAVSYALFDANNLSMPHWSSATTGQHLGSDGTIPVWTSGAWEFVAEFEPSADASFTIHHAGFDGTPTNMLDDYTYLVSGYLFGTEAQQAVVQLYEDVTGTPTLRNGGSDYQRSHVGHSSAVSAVGSAPNSNMLFAQALWGTTIDAACHFETVVNGIESGVVTTVFSRSVGVTDAGADYQFSTMGYTYDSGTSATRKLDYINVFPTTGTCTGKLKLYRQKGV